jgi:hypothetical protein
MRKLADNEVPLCMALQWSRDPNCGKMFVLQENDPGEIMVSFERKIKLFCIVQKQFYFSVGGIYVPGAS